MIFFFGLGRRTIPKKLMEYDFTLDNITSNSVRIRWNPEILKSNVIDNLKFSVLSAKTDIRLLLVRPPVESGCVIIDHLNASSPYRLFATCKGKYVRTIELEKFETWPSGGSVYYLHK